MVILRTLITTILALSLANAASAEPDVLSVTFGNNSHTLDVPAMGRLDAFAQTLHNYKIADSRILVDAYTDNVGSTAYNLRLSMRRALSVKTYLAVKHKVPLGGFVNRGLGEVAPVASNDTTDGRNKNRRVVISIVPSDAADAPPPAQVPFNLVATTNRGDRPIYYIGEQLVLMMEATRDAYLYCFYAQANGEVLQLFPNPYRKSAKVSGHHIVSIPNHTMEFEWSITEPTGKEHLQCFSAPEDITAALPEDLRKADFTPLPFKSLDEIRRAVKGTNPNVISSSVMSVVVEEGKTSK